MTAARQEPTPEPQPMHAAPQPAREAESPAPAGRYRSARRATSHAGEEPGYGHGV